MKKRSTQLIISGQNQLISDALDDFLLAQRVANHSPRTTEFYAENVGRFIWWLRELGYSENVDDVEPSHIRLFTQYVQTNTGRWGSDNRNANKRASDSTVQAYFRALRAFFNWCEKEQYVEASPFSDKRLPTPKVRQKIVPSYEIDEILAMLRACERDTVNRLRDSAIILLLLDTGIRASELAGLQLSDLERGRIKVLGKGNKERYLPLNPITEKALRDYARKEREEGGSYLFIGRGIDRLSYDGVREIIRRRGREAGVAGARVHRFRHHFAVAYLAAGGGLNTLQAILGHTNAAMSMKYAAMVSQGTQELHKQFSPVEAVRKAKK